MSEGAVTAMKKLAIIVLATAGLSLLLAWSTPAYGDPYPGPATQAEKPSSAPMPTIAPTATPEPTSTGVPTWMKRYWGRRVHRVLTSKRVVALTFDDGPNFRTKTAVRILDSYGAKGTFFAIGTCSKAPNMAAANRYVIAHGHELANHTMHHDRLDGTFAHSLAVINSLEKLLKAQTGKGTTWVRAMGGDVTATGLRATRTSGHLYAQWSVSSGDAVVRYTPPDELYHHVVDHIRPGSIVLMHVTHAETLAALPRICRELKRRGYKMVTLSELAPLGNPYP